MKKPTIPLKFTVELPRGRHHRALFRSDLPFQPRQEQPKTRYQRRPKHRYQDQEQM